MAHACEQKHPTLDGDAGREDPQIPMGAGNNQQDKQDLPSGSPPHPKMHPEFMPWGGKRVGGASPTHLQHGSLSKKASSPMENEATQGPAYVPWPQQSRRPDCSHITAWRGSAEPRGKGEGVLGGHGNFSVLMEVMGKDAAP